MSGSACTPLTDSDQDQLDNCRAWVEGQALPAYLHDNPVEASGVSETVAGRLSLLRALLDQEGADWDQDKLVAMGVVFGDTLAEYLSLDWCVFEDEHGRSMALQAVGTPIVLFPESILAKRVQAGEWIDVFELFSGIAVQVESYKQTRLETD